MFEVGDTRWASLAGVDDIAAVVMGLGVLLEPQPAWLMRSLSVDSAVSLNSGRRWRIRSPVGRRTPPVSSVPVERSIGVPLFEFVCSWSSWSLEGMCSPGGTYSQNPRFEVAIAQVADDRSPRGAHVASHDQADAMATTPR